MFKVLQINANYKKTPQNDLRSLFQLKSLIAFPLEQDLFQSAYHYVFPMNVFFSIHFETEFTVKIQCGVISVIYAQKNFFSVRIFYL